MRRLLPGRRPLLPPVEQLRYGPDGYVAVGGDLAPDTIVEAYLKGVFPWDHRTPLSWYSPEPRLVLEPARFKASRSLVKRVRHGGFDVDYDVDFHGVIAACAAMPRRGQVGTWITGRTHRAFGALHRAGLAHSVETFQTRREGGEPVRRRVGGLYGVTLGRVFFGESLFTWESDASKIALWDLCLRLAEAGFVAIDCQQDTPHMRALGAEPWSRARWLATLDAHAHEPVPWAAAAAAPGIRALR